MRCPRRPTRLAPHLQVVERQAVLHVVVGSRPLYLKVDSFAGHVRGRVGKRPHHLLLRRLRARLFATARIIDPKATPVHLNLRFLVVALASTVPRLAVVLLAVCGSFLTRTRDCAVLSVSLSLLLHVRLLLCCLLASILLLRAGIAAWSRNSAIVLL